MGEITKIEWTDHTFNPWVGCTKIAPGCANCPASADMDKRRHFAQWGPHGTRVKTSEANWKKPIKWNRAARAAGVRRRVFCSSLADVYEDWQGPITDHERQQLYISDQEPGRYPAVPFAGFESLTEYERQNITNGVYRPATLQDLRGDLFRLIDETKWLDWQLLTKRPENIDRMWPPRDDFEYSPEAGSLNEFNEFYRDNVWLGTSVSEQATAAENIPTLLKSAKLAPVMFVSAQPLLGPIDLTVLPHVDWVIVGGESGPDARPSMVEWANAIQEQCRDACIPVFRNQLGAVPYHGQTFPEWPQKSLFEPLTEPNGEGRYRIHLRDSKGGDWSEWPVAWRVREFPHVTVN